jgi:hypothetical protein
LIVSDLSAGFEGLYGEKLRRRIVPSLIEKLTIRPRTFNMWELPVAPLIKGRFTSASIM